VGGGLGKVGKWGETVGRPAIRLGLRKFSTGKVGYFPPKLSSAIRDLEKLSTAGLSLVAGGGRGAW
jgi:hypothetical protein